MSNSTEDRIQTLLQSPLYYAVTGASFGIAMYAAFMSWGFVEHVDLIPATWKGTLAVSVVAGPLFGLAMYGAIRRLKRKGTLEEHIKRQAARIDGGWLSLRHRYWRAAVLTVVSLGVAVLLTYHAAAGTSPPYVFAIAGVFFYGLLGSGILMMGYGLYWILAGKADAEDFFAGTFFLRNRYVRGAVVVMGLLGGAALFYYNYIINAPFSTASLIAGVSFSLAICLGIMITVEAALRRLWQWRRKGSQNGEAPRKA